MNKDLESLICNIHVNFLDFCKRWEKDSSYNRVNLKKKLVKDIGTEKDILETIYGYQSFLSQETVKLELFLKQQTNCNSRVLTRVKTLNSIEDKIERYTNHKPEKGEIPICKCLNDLFGTRIIQDESVDIEQIKEFLKTNYEKLKCIDSSKDEYKAKHIYFVNTNYDFQWELQIWKKEDEENNMRSHAQRKQGYTGWETEKGG